MRYAYVCVFNIIDWYTNIIYHLQAGMYFFCFLISVLRLHWWQEKAMKKYRYLDIVFDWKIYWTHIFCSESSFDYIGKRKELIVKTIDFWSPRKVVNKWNVQKNRLKSGNNISFYKTSLNMAKIKSVNIEYFQIRIREQFYENIRSNARVKARLYIKRTITNLIKPKCILF